MSLAGFCLPLRSTPSELSGDDLDALWSELTEELGGWIATRLTREVEEELLDCADEQLDWPCEVPSEGIDFVFAEHHLVASEAGQHWYLRALHARRDAVQALLASHGFEADFDRLPSTDDGTILVFANDEDAEHDVVTVWPDHLDEVGFEDGALEVSALDDELRRAVEEARSTAHCQCSLCRAARASRPDFS